MVQITHTHRHHKQISVWNPTKRKDNHSVIIHRISAKKPVWRNKEIQNPPWNCQCRCIGCICVLPGAPLGRPDPGYIKAKIPYTKTKSTGIQSCGPPQKKPEGYPRQYGVTYLQEKILTTDHSHQAADTRRLFLCHAIMRLFYNLQRGA